jgi:hypothetical protein
VKQSRQGLFVALVSISMSAGCTAAYYRTLESIGIEKRDILVDRITDARDSQTRAKEQFTSALDRYRSVVDVEAGGLEETYDRLNAAYQRSERRAEDVRERINAVESVAGDLFDEWEDEIGDYSDPTLRRQSQRLLANTREDYRDLIGAMRRAEAAMDPVLTLFQDQVLILRHNLNARAIGSLENELDNIERATADLIDEMERAITEASRFIEAMA